MKNYKLDLQLFASKKGVGSTKNGRDSQPKFLGAKIADGQMAKLVKSFTVKEGLEFILETMLVWEKTTHCLQKYQVLLNIKHLVIIKQKLK